jgi:1,4-dihydroxy-2-naphthoyl-CoA synthase
VISHANVRYETHDRGRIAHVTVDHAAKLNSLSSEVMDQFVDRFRGLAADPALRAVVLTGAGDKAFIGGANIDEMAALGSPQAARAFILKVHGCCDAIRQTPVPVIAAVNGWCLGAGLEVAAACDLRLAADTAQFGMPEVKLGLPSVVEAALLPSLIGWGRTRRILMTGERPGISRHGPRSATSVRIGFAPRHRSRASLPESVDRPLSRTSPTAPRSSRHRSFSKPAAGSMAGKYGATMAASSASSTAVSRSRSRLGRDARKQREPPASNPRRAQILRSKAVAAQLRVTASNRSSHDRNGRFGGKRAGRTLLRCRPAEVDAAPRVGDDLRS